MSLSRDDEVDQYVKAYKSEQYRMGVRRKADVTRILSGFARGETLLDVGTGRGETLQIADSFGLLPHGTEVVPYLLNSRVTKAYAHMLPFEDGSFDHVTCFDVLEHLTEPDIRPALREMLRVARKTVTVSASELSDIRRDPETGKMRELHITKRPKSAWLAVIRECWGPRASDFGTAGRSPAFRVVK